MPSFNLWKILRCLVGSWQICMSITTQSGTLQLTDTLPTIVRSVTQSHSVFYYSVRQLFCISTGKKRLQKKRLVEAAEIASANNRCDSIPSILLSVKEHELLAWTHVLFWHSSIFPFRFSFFLFFAVPMGVHMLRSRNKKLQLIVSAFPDLFLSRVLCFLFYEEICTFSL